MKTRVQIFISLTLIVLGFLLLTKLSKAADTDIIISEIGAYEKGDYEWLEIYNKGSAPVDLTGWKFYEDKTNHKLNTFQNDLIIDPAEYAIIANVAENFKQAHPDFTGTIIDSSWSSLKEDGEEIGLKNAKLEIVELFTYLPCPDTSLQRIDLNLNDYTSANWQVHPTSNSAGKANEFNTDEQNPDTNQNTNSANQNINDNQNSNTNTNTNSDQTNSNQNTNSNTNSSDDQTNQNINGAPEPSTSKPSKIVSSGTLVINEFVSDPADGEVEWIELYNKNVFDIDLTGWKIIDGSGAETNLKGIIGSNFDNRFFVIESPKGKLNNSGDAIILKDNKNNIIDGVYYGNWDSGFIEQNAPVAKDPNSTARIFDGAETFNNKNDFVVTQTPTKGEANVITLTEDEKQAVTDMADPSSSLNTDATKPSTADFKSIIINEIYPNPPGSDLEFEFIELKNIGNETIDLAGWQIKNNSKKAYKISAKDFQSTLINPNEFFVIERRISGLALKNDKETVKLIAPNDKTMQTVKYSEEENMPEDVAYAQDSENNWFWTTTPTRNQDNIITKLNHVPEIAIYCPKEAEINELIICDASDSYDLEDDKLSFTWQIENQIYQNVIAQHQFKQKGTYSIALIISDGQLESKEAAKIKILDSSEKVEFSAAMTKVADNKSSQTKSSGTVATDLKLVRTLALGTKVKTQGKVSVLPNIFGKTIIYLTGMQVYFSKASWPSLKLGDLVEVSGTLSEALGEKRIKLAKASDIGIIENQSPPEPRVIKNSEINDELVGYLVQTSGQIIEKSGTKFTLQDETGEADVYLKPNTKISATNFQTGDKLSITGIISKNGEAYRLLPRFSEDIQRQIQQNLAPSTILEKNNQSQTVLKYLIISAISLAVGLAILFYKKITLKAKDRTPNSEV